MAEAEETDPATSQVATKRQQAIPITKGRPSVIINTMLARLQQIMMSLPSICSYTSERTSKMVMILEMHWKHWKKLCLKHQH